MDGTAQQGSDNSNTQPKRRRRGPTRMKQVVLINEATKIPVELDEDMKGIGKNGATFSSYVGHIVRSKISVAYVSWKAVPNKDKNMIWEDILQHFDIPATERVRHRVLKQADERWRDFKSSLARQYIRGAKKGQHPKDTYPNVSEEAWQQLLQRREDVQFEAISERNQEIAKKNVYKHYMSRGGYSALERRMLEESMQAAQKIAASDPNVDISPVERPTRQQKWKAARMKNGNYITPEVAAVAERIDELEEQATQGSFVSQRGMDILETAIGIPDYAGRVRGAPKGVIRKDFFGSTSRKLSASGESMVSRAEHEAALQKLRDEMDAKLNETMLMIGRTTGGQFSHVPEQPSEEILPVVTSSNNHKLGSNQKLKKTVEKEADKLKPIDPGATDELTNIDLTTNTTSSGSYGKRKRGEGSKRNPKQKVPTSIVLVDTISVIATASKERTSTLNKIKEVSFGEVAVELLSIQEIVSNDDLRTRCLKLMMHKTCRDMFVALKGQSRDYLLHWLRDMAYNPPPWLKVPPC